MKARLGRALVIAVLLLSAVLGLPNGLNDLAVAGTALQKSVTYGVLLYSVLGLVAAAGVVAGKRWAVTIAAVWGLTIVFVGSVSSVAYGGASASSSETIASGVASALIAGAVIWGVTRSMRRAERPAASTPATAE